jgi:uncharacterized protein DUF6335
MARRKAQKRKRAATAARKRTTRRTSGKRPSRKVRASARPARRKKAATPRKRPMTAPRLDRARRTLDDTVPTPPSSLNMKRRGTAVRTGRAEVAESLLDHKGMSPAITAGDVDVDVEDAYFTGDESPGGDNSTPDQDIVDDIGRALGVEYQDNEELKAVDKVTERDRKRWELDPASSEDYKDRK